MDARCCDLKRLEYDSVCPARSCDHKRGRKPCATEPVEESRDMRCASVRMHHWQELQGLENGMLRARVHVRDGATRRPVPPAPSPLAKQRRRSSCSPAVGPRFHACRATGEGAAGSRLRVGTVARPCRGARPPEFLQFMNFLLLEYPKVKLFDFFSL